MVSSREESRPGPKWKTKLPGVRHAINPARTTRANPLVTSDKVFVSLFAPGAIIAIGRETGDILWSKTLDSYGSSAVLVHDRVLYGTSARTLFALDPKNGNVHWEFSPRSTNGEWLYSQPTLSAGRVFFGDRCGYFHCLDAKTGRSIWRRQSSRGCNNQVNSTAVATGDRIISANNEGAVVCYAAKSGETLWRQRINSGCIGELLRYRDTVIVAGTSLNQIDPKTGRIRKRLMFPGKLFASIAVSGSRIAAILGTDFQSVPSAWDEPSAFDGELVIIEGGSDIARRALKGTPQVRSCDETGLVFVAGRTKLALVDPSNGSQLISRRGGIALPMIYKGVLYSLTDTGLLSAERIRLPD